MDHHQTRFSQKQVEGEILNALGWIASGVDGKVAIRHHCNIPDVRNPWLVRSGRNAVHLCIYHGMETCVLQFGDCFLREDSLWKDHYSIVRQPSSLLVQRHSPDRL